MKRLQVTVLAAVCFLSLFTAGCGTGPSTVEHYVSPKVQGETDKINLDEVQKAFWQTQGKDFKSWMAAFEKRVNEIYEGKDVVSIDATREKGHLVVTGYIDTQKQQGFKPGDEKLFTVEQTGDAVDNQMPYRVTQQDGRVYYEGHHSILDNPILQMMIFSHMMGGWGGSYYTPRDRVVVLDNYRNSYRATPQYQTQRTSNSGFFSRFKQQPGGGLTSSKGFGTSGFSQAPGAASRTWGASTPAGSSQTSTTSGWGGRRATSGFGTSSGFSGFRSSRGWGGRRR